MEQSDFLRLALEVLESQAIPYMVVGSYASSVWGDPRFTQDIDIVVDLHHSQAAALCAAFPSPEFYVSESAASEAIRFGKQFNVLHPASGNKIDFMIARSDEWGREQLARRRTLQLLPDRLGQVASPEDVILSKLRYYREGGSEKHLRDITGILRMQGPDVDQDDITQWSQRLGVNEIWLAVLRRLASE